MLHHALDNHQLLVIFFAKHGDIGLYAVKQLVHHSAHAHKKTWAKRALQNVCQLRWRMYFKNLRLGVEVFFLRCEDDIATLCF